MADLQAIVARVRDALAARSDAHEAAPPAAASAPVGNRAELASRFARELEAVGGRTIGPIAPHELAGCVVALARERGLMSVAVGQGVGSDLDSAAQALLTAGIGVMRTLAATPANQGRADENGKGEFKDRMARIDGAVAEADCAIASTGTLAVLSDAGRPSALTLLPPASIIVLRIERMAPDLAGALETIGPDAVMAHRLTLITGPSRTADIEKRIVMGVHGPKSLDVILVWPGDD